jgi:hypothetical protein
MGAHVFEEAYNLVLHMGVREYGGKGKPSSIMDYRCACSQVVLEQNILDRLALTPLGAVASNRHSCFLRGPTYESVWSTSN